MALAVFCGCRSPKPPTPIVVPPSISVQPQSQTVQAGSPVSFNVTASSVPAPAFQWCFNGTNLSGATEATLTLAKARPIHAGNYAVIVSNVAGYVQSAVAVLTVRVPPPIFRETNVTRTIGAPEPVVSPDPK